MYKKGDLVEVILPTDVDMLMNIEKGIIGEVVGIRNSKEVQVTFNVDHGLRYSFYPMYIDQIIPYTPK